jgi:uncharacterized protein (TIGR02145 family)
MRFFNRLGRVMVLLSAVVLMVCVGSAFAQSETFTDPRDGKTYKAVKIGKQIWMAENLNYQAGNSWCYYNNNSNCQKYGRLYHWNTAISICPSGWHLPTDAEWKTLEATAGGEVAGRRLMSRTGWFEYGNCGNGTDDFGFAALPGGRIFNRLGEFVESDKGFWWTATVSPGGGSAIFRSLGCSEYGYGCGWGTSAGAHSVRCVKD